MMTIQNRETLPLLQAGTPLEQATGALVLLHGRGGSAEDILGLGSALAGNRWALLEHQLAAHQQRRSIHPL